MKEKIIFDYSKLKGRITEKFGKQENIAKHLSYGYTSLSMKLNNHVSFSQEDIIELSRVLEIPGDQVSLYFFNVKVRKTVQKEKV